MPLTPEDIFDDNGDTEAEIARKDRRPATRGEIRRIVTEIHRLNGEIEKRPTTWEVRTLILAAFAGAAFLPTVEVARAAIGAVIP